MQGMCTFKNKKRRKNDLLGVYQGAGLVISDVK